MSTEARFAPGDWYAVVGERVTVLLPGSQRARVAGLWDLADSGADADALLDALLAEGLSSLDHVALVAHGDDATRLIVRGAPSAAVAATSGEEIVERRRRGSLGRAAGHRRHQHPGDPHRRRRRRPRS